VSAKARPQDYAQAIYELALETWTRQLSEIQKALRKDAALRQALSDAGTQPAERLATLVQAVPGGLTRQVRNFVGRLLEDGQVDQLDAILDEFERLVTHRMELRQAFVTTAVDLTDAERRALSARLTDQYGPDLEIHFDVDASLLGGVRLRIGDRVIDGSVAGKLAAMRDRLTA
jgi:F-type H+-transporting ATPase subunit delta